MLLWIKDQEIKKSKDRKVILIENPFPDDIDFNLISFLEENVISIILQNTWELSEKKVSTLPGSV